MSVEKERVHPVISVRNVSMEFRIPRESSDSLKEYLIRGLTRQFLHSWRVRFDHPATGETIERRDTLPYDLLDVLEEIAPLSMGRTPEGDKIVPQILEAW